MEEAGICLLKEGFTLKSLVGTCFDIIGRKKDIVLLVKALHDANSITEENAREMAHVASYLGAAPLIIAEKAQHDLLDNVVYQRFGITALTLTTVKGCLRSHLPFLKSTHAGLTADIRGGRLRQAREQEGLSLQELGQKLGVSKKMVQRYESGRAGISITKAMKLHHALGPEIFQGIDIFAKHPLPESPASSDIARKYAALGFSSADTSKVPFDIIAKKEKEIILTNVGDRVKPQMEELSALLDADKLVIFRKKKPKNIPAMTEEEFMDFEEAKELIRVVKEFS